MKESATYGTMYISFCININARYFFHCHWFCWQSSFNEISPIAKFFVFFFHICHASRLQGNCFFQLLQNSSPLCYTCHHLLFEYTSGLLNSPDMVTFVFIVRRLFFESGTSLLESFTVSRVGDLGWMTNSTTAINVPSDSLSKAWFRVFNNPFKKVAAGLICHAQTPPI